MKKLIISFVAFSAAVILGMGLIANAAILNSNQVGTNPQNGYYLQTNGVTSTWATVSGGSGSSTLIYASSGISATASGTNGYIIGNTGVTSFNGATGTVIFSTSTFSTSSISGTSGTIPMFSGTQNLINSLLSQLGSAITALGNLFVSGTLNVSSTATFQATSTFLGNVSTTIAANSFVATNGQGILVATGTPGGSSSVQLPVITVSIQAGANYASSSLIAAVTACSNKTTYPNGANIYLPDSSYTVTSTIKLATGCSLIGNLNYSTLNISATSIGSFNSPGTSLIAASGTPSYNEIENLVLNNTSSTYSGTAFNMSNFGNLYVNNIKSIGFFMSIYANDTSNNTFYDYIANWAGYDNNGFISSSTNPVNDNTFMNDQFGIHQTNGESPYYAFYLNNAQSNKFYGADSEPAIQASTTALYITGTNTADNDFYGSYFESNATTTWIGGGYRTSFFGGQWLTPKTQAQNFINGGTDTQAIGVDNNSTGELNQYSISASSSFVDTSNASQGITFQNNTNFAHTGGTPLVTMQLLNGTDSDNDLNLTNAGTGNALNIAQGRIGFATSTVSVSACGGGSPTVLGSNSVGAVTIGTGGITSCKVSFATPTYKLPPVCIVSDSSSTDSTEVTAVSSSSVTIGFNLSLAAGTAYYQCFGNPN